MKATQLLKTLLMAGAILLPQGSLLAVPNTFDWDGSSNDMSDSNNWQGPFFSTSTFTGPSPGDNILFPDLTLGNTNNAPFQTVPFTYSALSFSGMSSGTGTIYTIQDGATAGISVTDVANNGDITGHTIRCRISSAFTLSAGASSNSSSSGPVGYAISDVPAALVFNGDSPYNSGLGGAFSVTGSGGVVSTAGIYSIGLGSLSTDDTASLDFRSGNTLSIGNDGTDTQVFSPICTAAGTGLVLTKVGSGTLELIGTQNFTGSSLVNGGRLRLTNEAVGVGSDFDISGGQTLEFHIDPSVTSLKSTAAASQIYSSQLSGNGGVTVSTINGTGNYVELTGANSYIGDTNVTSSSLMGWRDAAIETPSDIFFDTSSSVDFTSLSGARTYGKSLHGSSATLTIGLVNTNQQVILDQPNALWTGTSAVNTGTFTLKNQAIAVPSDIRLYSTTLPIVEFSTADGNPYTYGNTIGDYGTGPYGSVLVTGTGLVTFNNSNFYRGDTSVNGGHLRLIDNAQETSTNYGLASATHLEFNAATHATYTYGKVISGDGVVLKSGSKQLIWTGAHSYTGTTTNQDGGILTLRDAAAELRSNINTNTGTVLEYNITTGSRTYARALAGGEIQKTGSGILYVTGNSTVNSLNVNEGTWSLGSGVFFSTNKTVIVKNGGRISGTGTLQDGGLTIQSGGFIRPGNSPGTLTTDGPYTQNGTYEAQVLGPTLAEGSLINITSNTTTLNNSTVSLIGASNFTPNQRYTILTTSGNALTDTYNPTVDVSALSTFVRAALSYDSHNVYLTLQKAISTTGLTANELAVADQLDSVTNASPFLDGLFIALSNLPQDQINKALNQMSGEQHTSSVLMAQNLGHQFIRRLYDPLRPLITPQTDPCACNPCKNFRDGCLVWGEAGGGGTRLKGNGNAHGLNSGGYEVTIGAQTTLCDKFTLGIAGSYTYNHVSYNIGGTENINSGFAGLYGLYNAKRFYVLTDVIFGYNKGNLTRPIETGDVEYAHAHSKPQVIECSFYGEIGINYCRWNIGFQPYVAVEVDRLWRQKAVETDAQDLNLTVSKFNQTFTQGSLGIHVTKMFRSYTFGLDLAWICRFTSYNNSITNLFEAPGTTTFVINGVPIDKNSVEGTLFFSKEICNGWSIFAEATCQVWSRFASYDGLVGIQSRW